MSDEKQRAVGYVYSIASGFRQPVITRENPRYGLALAMIHDIANWALHPTWGDEPPYVERAALDGGKEG